MRVHAERNQIALRQAEEQRRIASARLAQTLRLDPVIALVAQDLDLTPLTLFETNAALGALVAQANSARPELKQSQAAVSAAEIGRAHV